MQNNIIHSTQLKEALIRSAGHLNNNSNVLDNLNVFPVPDGDTGTNMAGTYVPAVTLLSDKEIRSIKDISSSIVPFMNHNSRGNSGFILSSFFKGFFLDKENKDAFDLSDISESFSKGAYQVHTSLFNPMAGTMVTIIEAIASSLKTADNNDIIAVLEKAVENARDVLFDTPKMLPTLARAGVIDSGALGFIIIMEGIIAGLKNEPLEKIEKENDYRFDPDPTISDEYSLKENQKQFCTEISVRKEKNPDHSLMHDFLSDSGNSIALTEDEDVIKLHIHTDRPQEVKQFMLQFGPVIREKIEDMHNQMLTSAVNGDASRENTVLFISPGDGFSSIMNELGVEHIITYKEQLPSVGDILQEVERIKFDNVIILPNNNNILPSCLSVKEKSNKNISIIPTSNVLEGMTSFYGFSENEEMQINIDSMKECQHLSKPFFIYKSIDERTFGQTNLGKGDYFTISNKNILAVNRDFTELVSITLKTQNISEFGNLTFFTKDESYNTELEALMEKINVEYPSLETELLHGGQNQCVCIISLE